MFVYSFQLYPKGLEMKYTLFKFQLQLVKYKIKHIISPPTLIHKNVERLIRLELVMCTDDQILSVSPNWIDRVQRGGDIYGVDNRARGAVYEFHQCRRPGSHELKHRMPFHIVAMKYHRGGKLLFPI